MRLSKPRPVGVAAVLSALLWFLTCAILCSRPGNMYTNKGVPEFIQKCVIVSRPTKRSVQIQSIDLIIIFLCDDVVCIIQGYVLDNKALQPCPIFPRKHEAHHEV